MTTNPWQQRWSEGRIGFHAEHVNPHLRDQADWLLEGGPRRVLVPLCGKSLDLAWLANRGHEVVGIELVPAAVEALHQEQGLHAVRTQVDGFEVWRSNRITVLQGDVFDLSPEILDQVPGRQRVLDRCWDRAALIALEPELRHRYAALIRKLLAPQGRMLLSTLEYDQAEMDGPPFSVPKAEVWTHYDGATIEEVHRQDMLASEPRWQERGLSRFVSTVSRITLPPAPAPDDAQGDAQSDKV